MNCKLKIVAAVVALGGALLASGAASASVVVFDNYSGVGGTHAINATGHGAEFKSDTNRTITGIGERLAANHDGDLKFAIFDLGANDTPDGGGALLFVQEKHFLADPTYNYKYSDAFSFDLLANHWYGVATIIASSSSNFVFTYDTATSVSPGAGFTAYADHNINIGNYTNPIAGGFGVGNIHFQLLEDSPAPAGVPEPATWSLMIGGFGLAGAAFRRRRAQMAATAA